MQERTHTPGSSIRTATASRVPVAAASAAPCCARGDTAASSAAAASHRPARIPIRMYYRQSRSPGAHAQRHKPPPPCGAEFWKLFQNSYASLKKGLSGALPNFHEFVRFTPPGPSCPRRRRHGLAVATAAMDFLRTPSETAGRLFRRPRSASLSSRLVSPRLRRACRARRNTAAPSPTFARRWW